MMQKFTGRVVGMPKQVVTTNTKRSVVHVRVSFIPQVKLNGTLPEFKDGAISDIQLSFWDEDFQAAIMADADKLVGKMITGYCDSITQRDQYYNGVGYAFVLEKKTAEFNAPQVQFQMIQGSAPTAPVAPV